MGKKGGSSSSWLTAVKRAFRSPSKDSPDKNRRRVDHDLHEDNDDKKREKRRWIFRKLSVANHESVNQLNQAATTSGTDNAAAAAENAIAMAVATAAAAEAAVATVQAAVEVARLTRPPTFSAREYYAAIVIQTAFRGYLARRALRALKGLVKLQALVRGHNVRKQAKMTLRCMQALVRVQSRILDQRMRLSHEDISRKSAFSDTTSLIESRYLRDISDRRSLSREVCSIPDDWDEKPHTVEEVKAMLQQRKEAAAAAAALKRERTLSQAFSQQAMRSGRRQSFGNEEELHERTQRATDHWGSARMLGDNSSSSSKVRASTDHRESIKTVEVDTSQPYTYHRRPNTQNQYHQQPQRPSSPSRQPNHRPSSPLHRTNQTTPSPSKTRPIQVRSASPRSVRDDRSYASSQTPSLRSNYQYNGYLRPQQGRGSAHNTTPTLPNYMAATESAKARIRSQSAPRQRPSTPERDRIGTAKKRLSYPAPDPYNCYGQGNNYLRSPSFKSVSCSHFGGLEQQSNYSSCCTESLGGEASPTSTSDLRRWLR